MKYESLRAGHLCVTRYLVLPTRELAIGLTEDLNAPSIHPILGFAALVLAKPNRVDILRAWGIGPMGWLVFSWPIPKPVNARSEHAIKLLFNIKVFLVAMRRVHRAALLLAHSINAATFESDRVFSDSWQRRGVDAVALRCVFDQQHRLN